VIGHVALTSVHSDARADLWTTAGRVDAQRLAAVARLFVAPEVRRRGVGRRLMEMAASEAHRRGQQPVLDVLEHDSAAIALYQGMGWRAIGVVEITLPTGRPVSSICFVGPLAAVGDSGSPVRSDWPPLIPTLSPHRHS
jgi:ribosomal protein S18 acetylase RimI-like enzyme